MCFRDTVRRLVRNTSGGAAAVFAVTLPVVVGGLGFGTEAGMWYFNERKLQNAADIAAYAAATELRAGRTLARMEAAATEAATRTGFNAARGELEVVTPVAGNAGDVEVRLTERMPRAFSAIFRGAGEVEVGGRAVARVSQGVQSCVLALDPSAGRAVTFSGNTEAIFVGCNVHSNSLADDSIYIQGSPEVTVDCISAAGRVDIADEEMLELTACVAPYERADVVPDPYADVPVPNTALPCASDSGGTLSPGRFCNELRLQGAVNLQPGVYVLDRGMRVNANAVVRGSGVTFYVRGSNEVSLNGSADIQVAAPTSGDYAGVLVFGDRGASSSTSHTINGNSSSVFHGAVYAPTAEVRYLGNNDQNGGCSQIVSRIVTFQGNSSVGIDCTSVTVRDIRSSRLITLVE